MDSLWPLKREGHLNHMCMKSRTLCGPAPWPREIRRGLSDSLCGTDGAVVNRLWRRGAGTRSCAASLARANRVFRFASFDCTGGSVPGGEWAGNLEGEALAAGTTARYVGTIASFGPCRTFGRSRARTKPRRSSPEQKFRVTARGLFDPFEDSVTYMIKEFWPDLRKRAKKRTGGLAAQASTTR